MPSTDRRTRAPQGAILLAAFALAGCTTLSNGWRDFSDTVSNGWQSVTGTEPNPLLQTQEGRLEIMQRCHTRAQARFPAARSVTFAQGHLTNTGTDGDAEYLGAIEVTSPAGQAQRFRFVCRIQPDGALDLRYI